MTEAPVRAATPPVSDVDPFSDEHLLNPEPLHQALREAGPVVYLSHYDVHALARYEQVHAALVDWQHFESGSGVGLANFRHEEPWRPPSLLLEADPPRHDAPRHVLRNILAPPALRRLQAAWSAVAEELVDEVLAQGPEFNAFTALAEAFPLRAFPDAVGIGPEGRENLLPYGNMAFNAFGPRNDLVAADADRAGDLSAWVNAQCAREALTEDGFGADIWAAADRGDLTYEQAPLVVRSLLTAGVDTTVHALSACLYAFATHPEKWQRLRERPELARVAFEEAMRWQSPVQTFFRTATTDVNVAGSVVPEGSKILMFLGAANRDPVRWSEPDRFDLTRDPSGHVGFGMGLHQCVGQHVARLEAEALLTALARRVESFELTGTPRRHANNTLRAWESLPVRVRPSA
ncbi:MULTISPECIES: cytochrome P450 [unclassified Streptomyces]|uniref:cytochrome P450 n=1 Tax=unclassified Streptomyces TaxID=2593676 RepID=UPI00224EE05D|nr:MULTISPECIES: cytochrome P450 [unclassified Streptomyces]MCX4641987.1 cytochrome P450 [Streptomyces sp. NBC_01446]MCX5326860.1 cytochrome P450 [Streptomyces sp. NBC_00120]